MVRGIGDDCAVLRLPRGHEALVTTDFSLESVHFRREWHPADCIGHRCLTRGLSDIAAMGGEPMATFLSLAVPADLPQDWVDCFLAGFMRLARRFKVRLAGGDIAQSPSGVLADVTVLGSAPRGKAVLRSGAKPGDDVYVTGNLGNGVAVLRELMSGRQAQGPSTPRAKTGRASLGMTFSKRASPNPAEEKHFYPTPRVEVGRWLRERGLASAMIDISDGLSTDLSHICEESRCGAWIAQSAVPVASGATLEDALHGGDEYELLFTAPAAKHTRIPARIAGVPVRWIGTITKPPGMWLVAPELKARVPLEAKGWEHFKNVSRSPFPVSRQRRGGND